MKNERVREGEESGPRVVLSSSHPECNSSPPSFAPYAYHNLSITLLALLLSQRLPRGFNHLVTHTVKCIIVLEYESLTL